MKSALVVLVVSAAAVLSGCGNACDHLQSAVNSSNSKATACGSNTSSFSNDTCQNNLHSCSQDDITKLDNYATCLDNLPSCPASSQASFDLGRLGCLSDLGGISVACAATQP